MWLACRKYHPTFGIPGTELRGTLQEQILELGRGWEWWPSALWQVLWTWIVCIDPSIIRTSNLRRLLLFSFGELGGFAILSDGVCKQLAAVSQS